MSENINSIFEQKYCYEPQHERIAAEYDTLSCLKFTEVRQVYLLQHKESGKKAILKCGCGQSGELLHNEYKTVRELCEVGIECGSLPKAIDYFYEDGMHYYIREYAEGRTLASCVEKSGVFSTKDACRVVGELCGTVHILHSCKPSIICRDINPDNVLICPDGSVRIIDLDSARRYNSSASSDTIWMGTKEMAAPEQFGYSQTNTRTDIYVLGMLLLYITTGSYDKFSKIPARLKKVIAKSTAFNPEERYATVLDMQRALMYDHRISVVVAAALILSALSLVLALANGVSASKADVFADGNSDMDIIASLPKTSVTVSSDGTDTTEPELMESTEDVIADTHELITDMTSDTAASSVTTTTAPVTSTTTPTTTTTTPATTTTTPTTITTTPATTTTTPTTSTTTRKQPSIPEEIPADGNWHIGSDGAYYLIHEGGYDEIPALEIDISGITDWSKIKTVYADVQYIGGDGGFFFYAKSNDGIVMTDAIDGRERIHTLHYDTQGKYHHSISLRSWWAHDGTVIKISNIYFSEEEHVAAEYGEWHENSDGTFSYKQGAAEGDGGTVPYLNSLLPAEGYADDWSSIYAVSADVEVTGGKAWLLVRGDLDGSYFLGMDMELMNESGTISYITDGKELGDRGVGLMCWYIEPYVEIKVSNVRYIYK